MCRARKSVKKMKAKKGKSVTCSIFFLKAAPPPFFFPSPFPRPSNTADMKFNLPYIFLLHLAVTKDIKTASADNLRTLEAEEPTLTHPSDGLTIISTGAEPSTTTDVLERRINELEAQLTELAQQVVGAPAGLADLADNVVGVSSRGLNKGKGKGKGKSCYDRDGELKLNWIGVYGDKYSNGSSHLTRMANLWVSQFSKSGHSEMTDLTPLSQSLKDPPARTRMSPLTATP